MPPVGPPDVFESDSQGPPQLEVEVSATSQRWPWRRAALLIELVIVFIALPTAFRFGLIDLPLIGAIVLLAVAAAAVLFFDRGFDRRSLWRTDSVRREMPRILGIFALAAAAGAITVLAISPEQFLEFARRNTGMWAIVMVLYPVFSVYPQEIVFRGFFFHRYASLFQRPWALIIASAVVFGYVHVVMGNTLSIVLSGIGGVLFGWTYLRTKSLPAVAVEHALYGCFIFTVGLGRYFYLAPGGS